MDSDLNVENINTSNDYDELGKALKMNPIGIHLAFPILN